MVIFIAKFKYPSLPLSTCMFQKCLLLFITGGSSNIIYKVDSKKIRLRKYIYLKVNNEF